MSVRIEWATAETSSAHVLEYGSAAADGNHVTHDLCLIIGSQAIEGTSEELIALLSRAVAEVQAEGRGLVGLEDEVIEARAIRTLLLAANERHERAEHEGEVCSEQRVGTLAFLAHSMGMKPVHIALVAEELAGYNERHHALHGHQS